MDQNVRSRWLKKLLAAAVLVFALSALPTKATAILSDASIGSGPILAMV